MRVRSTPVTRKRRKRWLKLAKGYWGHKSISYKMAKQAVIKSWTYSFRDRKQLKREFRKLWIARINAATRAQGINYSRFMNGLKKADINLNRKMLSELAIHKPEVFNAIINDVKKHIEVK